MSDGKSESLENVIEREYFESYPLNNEICKIEKNIKMLQIDYDAKLETFTVPKKIKERSKGSLPSPPIFIAHLVDVGKGYFVLSYLKEIIFFSFHLSCLCSYLSFDSPTYQLE